MLHFSSPSGSPRIGIDLPLQARLALESLPPFRLISHWTILPSELASGIAYNGAVLSAMQLALGQSHGLYIFPGFGLGPDATHVQKRAAMDQYSKKLSVNPYEILIYHPAGGGGVTPSLLVTEFITELAGSLLAAFLLLMTSLKGFASRLGFVMLCGIMASISTNISYWNWYGFPALYTVAYIAMGFVGYICAGAAIALVLARVDGGY